MKWWDGDTLLNDNKSESLKNYMFASVPFSLLLYVHKHLLYLLRYNRRVLLVIQSCEVYTMLYHCHSIKNRHILCYLGHVLDTIAFQALSGLETVTSLFAVKPFSNLFCLYIFLCHRSVNYVELRRSYLTWSSEMPPEAHASSHSSITTVISKAIPHSQIS